MSVTIHLARHARHDEVGRVLSGRSAIALDAEGRRQAEKLAARLAGTPLAAIHASPRRRAQETAAAVARHHALTVETIDALDEVDFGAWTGLAFDALDRDPAWARWNAARGSARAPGGETMGEATARAVDHLAAIGESGEVLCVSHCDIIRGIVAHHLGLGLDRLLAFDVDPASLTTLVLGEGGGRLVTLNERVA